MKLRNPTMILSFAVLVVSLGYGLVLPVMPFYIESLGAGGRELGWLTSCYALMQTICAPFWGILSDRIGRRPVLAIGMLGYAVTLFMFGLASTFTALFIARFLSGILSSATSAAAMAYIGDSASEKERSANMGRQAAAMSVGVVIGPVGGGILAEYSLSLPFFTGAGIALIALLLIVFLLPESHPPQPDADRRILPDKAYLRRTMFGPSGVILLLILTTSFALTGFQGITGLYVVDKFAFNSKQVGAVWMVMAGVLILVQGTLIGPLTQKFGEWALILTGLAGGALSLFAMTQATGFPGILLVLSFFAFFLALTSPTLKALLSTFAEGHQGALMGLSGTVQNLGKVIGPLSAGYFYEANIEFPYISGGVVSILGLIVCVVWVKTGQRNDRNRF